MSTGFGAGGPSVRRSGSSAYSGALRRPPGAPAALPAGFRLGQTRQCKTEAAEVVPPPPRTRVLSHTAQLGQTWDCLGSQKHDVVAMVLLFLEDVGKLGACRHRADHGGVAHPVLPFPIGHTPCVGVCLCSSDAIDWPTACDRLMIETTKQVRDYFCEQFDHRKEQRRVAIAEKKRARAEAAAAAAEAEAEAAAEAAAAAEAEAEAEAAAEAAAEQE